MEFVCYLAENEINVLLHRPSKEEDGYKKNKASCTHIVHRYSPIDQHQRQVLYRGKKSFQLTKHEQIYLKNLFYKSYRFNG